MTETTSTVAPPSLDIESQDAQTSEDGRRRWSSRWAFWLAAVGSAVGLGNLWRFPWQCATWGGGPFLVAYIVCLILLGMPILTQELALGQKHRSGDIEAFGRMNWRLRGIGLASVIGTFGIISYYSVVIGMSLVFLFASMQENLPYNTDNAGYWATDVMIVCDYPVTSECASEFAWKLWVSTLFVFVMTYFCIWKGVLSASNVVKITMPLPLLFLLILLIRSLFLDGATDGIGEYLNFSDWSELSHTGVWDAAVGQCFFSLSVCMGVMTAYGSYNPIKQDIATDEKVISLLDLSVSLFAGFVVYTVLGYLQYNETDPDVNWYSTASFGLVFQAYPVAISTFGDGKQVFAVLFFLVLFLLGIDSLFSMVEGLSTVIVDSDVGRQFNLNTQVTSLAICVGGSLFSLIYCFGGGIYWLDIVDRYINNYGMVFLGICECTATGWFYGTQRQINKVGTKSIELYRIGFFISWALSLIIAFVSTIDYWFIGLIIGIIGVIISFIIAQKYIYVELAGGDDAQELTLTQEMWYIMGWEGTEELRDFMNSNVPTLGDTWYDIRLTQNGECKALLHGVSIIWGFLIKYFIPVSLSVVLTGVAVEDSKEPYGGYEWDDLSMGIVIFSMMVLIVVIIVIFPQMLKQTSDESGLSPTGKAIDNKNKKSSGAASSPLAAQRVQTFETEEPATTKKTETTDEIKAEAVSSALDLGGDTQEYVD